MSGTKWRNRAVVRRKPRRSPALGNAGGLTSLNRLASERLTALMEARAALLQRAQAGDLEALTFCYRHLRLRFPLVEGRLTVSLPWMGTPTLEGK